MNPQSYWCNKQCVVAGGSGGLGYSIARTLGHHGASVVICGRHKLRLDDAAAGLRDIFARGRLLTFAADITRQEDCESLADFATGELGGVDLLANCVGVSTRAPLMEVDASEFNRLWEVNFLSTVRMTRLLADEIANRRGHVVNIGSLASKVGARYMGAYPATKFALAAYSQQLRMEFGPRGLHSLLVCPGPIAREDAGKRYTASDALPETARLPGAGAKLRAIDPDRLAERILRACERRRPELVVPAKARLLFAVSQLWPRLGDWLLRKSSSG